MTAIRHNSHEFSVGKTDDQTLIQAIIDKDELPLPKGSYAKMLSMFDDDKYGSKEIVTAIQANPALTTKIIGAANSAAYISMRKSNTLSEAVVKIGMFRIRQIVFSVSLIDSHRKGTNDSGFDYDSYWKHSLSMDVIAEELGHSGEFKFQSGDLFTAGLLSQIAWLSLAAAFPAHVSNLFAKLGDGESLDDAIKNTIIIQPAHISAALINKIGMAPWMSNAIGLHETVIDDLMDDRVREAVHILRHANAIAQTMCRFPLSYRGTVKEDPSPVMQNEWKSWLSLVGLPH